MDSIPWAVAWMVNLPSVSPDVNSPSSEIVAPAARSATNAEQQTAKALPTAQDRLQFGRQAVDDIVPQVAEKWLTQQAELTQFQKQFLEKTLAFYQHPDEPQLRETLAWTLKSLGGLLSFTGQVPVAEKELRRALEVFQSMAQEIGCIGLRFLGHTPTRTANK